ncbi:hypothetical protein P280DRAFT_222141 [Massarina eburnea CBS 473.64]|uniref:Secreted protein n=1 Tax=Massarina eburnea CBS 473.64 TaxID=1395130 RepID=A0A6A6SCQ3_9PLEO|nr:hypothetical protein P280DRAFT_222141 [Massarina eburnea CBS 473.64]
MYVCSVVCYLLGFFFLLECLSYLGGRALEVDCRYFDGWDAGKSLLKLGILLVGEEMRWSFFLAGTRGGRRFCTPVSCMFTYVCTRPLDRWMDGWLGWVGWESGD